MSVEETSRLFKKEVLPPERSIETSDGFIRKKKPRACVHPADQTGVPLESSIYIRKLYLILRFSCAFVDY